MRILVTGGAGYIGSITTKKLLEAGYNVVVFDNLEGGHQAATDLLKVPLVKGDLCQPDDVKRLFAAHKFDAILHFAAFALVGESMAQPGRYYQNNVGGSLNIIEKALEHEVGHFILSSTSEVYGEAQALPITEEHPCNPTNPYGHSKRLVEEILVQISSLKPDFRFISLRYFNAAGALMDGTMGEDHRPESHLIPSAILAALGRQEFFLTFSPVKTRDGSTIRDYIHVEDLAAAHLAALEALAQGHAPDFFNVGVGQGYSTLQIVDEIQRLAGLKLAIKEGRRRQGEPAEKFANCEKIKKDIGWQPRYGLKEIIGSAWRWHRNHPQGYDS